MPRTDEPRAGRDEHVDCVVIGSGFGGSVSAYRLAEAGRTVVLLERGKPYAPGDFPRTPAEMARNFWDPGAGLHGLLDIWTFRGLEGVVASGLGGGSLIYANVLLRKDEKWFVQESPLPGGGYEHWPISRATLDPHYDAVERMLGATPYPYVDTPKTRELREAAARRGLHWQLPNLAVSFAAEPGGRAVPGAPLPLAPYGNLHGRPRRTCRLVGECDLGCNDGAKNTLDHTYLSAAAHHGADLRSRSEVTGLAPIAGGGYQVRYVEHADSADGRRTRTADLPTRTITCDRLILSAGTFGSTYLLLRNRGAFPGLSRMLGTRFSGNGDLLGFLLHARDARTPTGRRDLDPSSGPVITSAIRVPDALDGDGDGDGASGRGFYVEDAGYPHFADWLLESTQLTGAARRGLTFALARLRHSVTRSPQSSMSADMMALLGAGAASRSALPLLGMGRDVPDGVMRLRPGQLDIDWTTRTSAAYFAGVHSTMRALAEELEATFVDNPLWATKRVVTVHPLGGAPMGRHPAEGVCDSFGEVFGYPGLHVLDGSSLPGPVGANPSLTIAAVADRACTRILESTPAVHRATPAAVGAGAAPPAPIPAPVPASSSTPCSTSVRFTEDMKGFVALGETDPRRGALLGRQLRQRLWCHLTITADDIDRFVADEQHAGRVEGDVHCDLLGGDLPVSQGWFNLFVPAADPAYRRMLYRLHFVDGGGNKLTLLGHKDVGDAAGLRVWKDTSTLYLTVVAGHVSPGDDAERAVVAAGVLKIFVRDFARQLTTFRTSGPDDVRALEAFGGLFLGELVDVYGHRLLARSR